MRKIKPLLILVFIFVFLVTYIGSAQAALPAPGLSNPLRGGGFIQEDDPPVAVAGEDQSVNTLSLVTLDGSDSYDLDEDYPLSYSWTQTGGTPVLLTGAATVAPSFTAPGDPDTLTFQLIVTDTDEGDSDPDTVVITVNNQAPTANAGDNQNVYQNTTVTLDGSGTDPDDDLPLTYLWAQTSGPGVTLNNYTAKEPTFAAPDDIATLIFSLVVTDSLGLASSADTVEIIVQNHAPVANAQSVTTSEDTPEAITLTGSDADGDDLTYSVVTPPSHGLLSGTEPNLTYTPATNYNGTDSFTFKVNDGIEDSNTATVSITIASINDAPVANPQSVTTSEDTAKAITLTGLDADGDTLTYSVVTPPSHGTLSGTAPNLTYTPAANYNGSDSFTFRAYDGTNYSAAATVTITITAVNDAPVALNEMYNTLKNSQLTVNLPGVLANDTDVDDVTLTAVLADSPVHGDLTLNANGSFTYTPDTNFIGSDSFTYQADDGELDSNVATVTITVFLDEPLLTYLPLLMQAAEFGLQPAPFTKISPFDGAIYQLPTPTLSWGASKQTTHFEYCYDKTNDGACSPWINAGIATSVTLPTLSLNTTYYWQVRAWNGIVGPVYANGSLGEFWAFTTTPVYPPPNTILNGGFESGDVVWAEYSSHGYDLIMDNSTALPYQPHSGTWLAWLGGVENEISSVSQTIAIPAGRSILHYWYASGSTYACNKDYFKVYAGSDVLFNQTICDDTMTGSWVHKTLDLTPYAGSTKTLKFELSTSNSTWSNLVLDDISLETTTVLSPSLEVDGVDALIIDTYLLELKKED